MNKAKSEVNLKIGKVHRMRASKSICLKFKKCILFNK